MVKLPILAGPLRGRWWLPAAGGKLLRILNGTYEPEQTRLFQQYLDTGATLLDVGAHVGYYTLLSAQLVGPAGRVIAFEPQPRNCAFLRDHVAANRLTNVEVMEVAVSDRNGSARFERGTGSGTGHLHADGEIEVRTVRLDDVCAERNVTPQAIKIDVEGAELDVLRGGSATIERARPVIFLSTHGARVHAECLTWLEAQRYRLLPVLGADLDRTSEVLCTPMEN